MTFIWIVAGVVVVAIALAVMFSRLQSPPPRNLSDEHIRTAVREGKQVAAIRWYRTLHGVDLKRAKREVALLAAEQPTASSDERAQGQ